MISRPYVFFCWLGIFMGVTFILKVTHSLLIPPTFAIILALMTSPAYYFMRKKKIPSIIVISFLMILISLFIYLVFMILYASVFSIVKFIPQYQNNLKDLWAFVSEKYHLQNSEGTLVYTGEVINYLYNSALKFSNQFFEITSSVVLVLLYYVFFMSEMETFVKKFSHAYDVESYERISNIIRDITVQISYYLSLKFFVSLLTGLGTVIILSFFNVNFAFVWGILAFVFNFIPTIGTLLILGVNALFAFLQFYPDFTTPTIVTLLTGCLHFILGNIVEPKIQGDRLDLSTFLLLFFFFFWSWVWGASGMFLAYPLTVVLKVTFENVPTLKPLAVLLSNGILISNKKDDSL